MKNFLLVSPLDEKAIYNQTSYFYSSNVNSEFINSPDVWNETNVVVGYREVLRRNANHTLVKITEFYPMAGRQHFNLYNVNKWSGWKTVTPT